MSDRRDRPPPPLPLPLAGLAGQLSFTFYWAHRFSADPGWTVPPPERRPYATLWLITEGELELESSEGARGCGPGTLAVWPPEAARPARNRAGGPATLYTAAFNLQVWGELDFFRVYRVPTLHTIARVPELAEPFAALVAELAAHAEAVTLVAEGWARVLVGRWLSDLERTGELTPAAGMDERLTAVLGAVESDLGGEWSLQRLADAMRLSPARMRELFVAGVGLPPMRYVSLRRLARARRLLHDTDLTSAEIAERCGFQDPAYFSRLFHRHCGLQPRAYREQARFVRE
jgi:AraC-like DNA-binding protein